MTIRLRKERLKPPLVILGGVPRVNLLPPSVGRREKERVTRRFLALAVLAVIAGVAVISDVAGLYRHTEETHLATLQVASEALLTKERDYAAAAAASATSSKITDVEQFVGKSDILWAPLLNVLTAAIEPDATISSTSSVASTGWTVASPNNVPLNPASVATSSITITFVSLDRLQAIVDRLLLVPAVVAVSPGAVAKTGSTYTTTISLSLGTDTYSKRFTGDRVQGSE